LQRAKSARLRLAEKPAKTLNEPQRHPIAVAPAPEPALAPALVTARIEGRDGERVRLTIGGRSVLAAVDPSVHPTVVAGAEARGERLLAERDEDGAWTVVGALRTQPTPGVDVAETYTIEADRVILRGRQDITLTTEAAGLVVRALGEVETYAERILSRAEGVHKIVGRMLRLN